jgi:hypothetical protein
MTTQQIMIELPEPILCQLRRIAEMTHQSAEGLIAQSVVSNLPPSADNTPPEIQADLLQMQTLPIEELLARCFADTARVAQAQVEPIQHKRHEALLEKNQDGFITPEERQELANLRVAADQLMLRKAYAWSVLRWRGHRLPALKELVVPL